MGKGIQLEIGVPFLVEHGARLAGRWEDVAQMCVDLLTGGWAPRANGTSLSL